MAVERTRTPDSGAETADEPQDDKPPPPPADRPGAPGRPSRAESRAAAQAPPDKSDQKPSDKPTGAEQRVPTPTDWSPRRASRETAAQPQDASATPPPPPATPVNWSPRQASRDAARDAQSSSPSAEPESEQFRATTDNPEDPRREPDDAISTDAETENDTPARAEETEYRKPEPTPAENHDSARAHDQAPAGLEEIEARAKAIGERYGVDVNFTDRPINPDHARLITEAMDTLSKDYPGIFKGLDEIRAQDLAEMQTRRPLVDNRVIAFATPKEVDPPPQGIYLNQHWFADDKLFDKRGNDDEKSGWSVPHGGTPHGVFYHEFGHHIGRRILANPAMRKDVEHALKEATGEGAWDLTLPRFGFPKQHNIIIDDLSEYGSTNPSEMLAEAFTEWRLNPNPRPLASAVGKVMDKHFKGVDQ